MIISVALKNSSYYEKFEGIKIDLEYEGRFMHIYVDGVKKFTCLQKTVYYINYF